MKKWLVVFMIMLFGFVLAACNQTPPEEEELDTIAPIMIGVMDTSIQKGQTFDPRAGVSATDNVDGNLTSTIVITGTVNLNQTGTYVLTYSVTDAAGNKTEIERSVTVTEVFLSDLRILNGDFGQQLAGTWTHWAGEGGASTVSIVNGEAVIDITANGNQWYSTQFNQGGLTITQGKMYRVEFEARADMARGIVVKIENASYQGYIDETVSLTTSMTKYTFEFYVTRPTIANGKLVIGAGTMASRGLDAGALTKVYLDNFVVTEVNPGVDDVAPIILGATPKIIEINQAFDPLDGITVSDNRDFALTPANIVITGTLDITTPGDYVLTYTLTDAANNSAVVERTITVLAGLVPSTWLVVNGDFETEQLTALPQPAETGWGWHGTGAFTAKIQNGMAIISVTNPGTVVHGVQFYQQNRVIEQGQIYRITFEAKSDIPRPIMVALEQGTTRRYDEIVFLTTEWQTFEIQIEFVLTGFTNGKFAFFLGDIGSTSVPTTVYLDNIEVETVRNLEDKTAPQLFGLDDYYVLKNSTFNPVQGVTIRDNVDKTLTNDNIVVTGTVNTAVVGEYTLTYKIKDAANNEATYTRKVMVIDSANMLSNTFVLVNNDFAIDQLTPMAQPATTGWGWHGAGTFTIAIQNGIATINVTNPGTVPHGVQFYMQNRVIETGATYRLTFKAKVDIPRSFRLSLEAGTDVRFFQIVNVTAEWATYEVFVTPSGGGFANGKLGFFMGYIDETSVATTFYLDDINIELVGYRQDTVKPFIFGVNAAQIVKGTAFNPTAGVTLFDNQDKTLIVASIVVTGSVDVNVAGVYTLTYTLTDRQGNQTVVERVVTVVEPT